MRYITNGEVTIMCNHIDPYVSYQYDDDTVRRTCVILYNVQEIDFNSLKDFLETGSYKEIEKTVNETTNEEIITEKDTLNGYNIIVTITDKRDGTFDVILGAPTKKEEYQATADMLLLEILGV